MKDLLDDKNKEQKAPINIPEPYNEVCKDCLKWQSYGDKCWVHWKGKKQCTFKARNSDEWRDEQRYR